MLDISITLVVIAHIVVSLLLILVILMQRPKQEGLGAAFGSGMTDAAWGARTTDVLQKGTVYLGTLFFVFSLVLAILMGKRNSIEGKNFASDGGSTANTTTEAPADTEPTLAGVTPAEEAAAAIQEAIEAETGGATPVETTPVETTPAETTPAETTPAETTPVETTPAETTPAETTPAETTPVETTPVETTPVETTPVETTPADQ